MKHKKSFPNLRKASGSTPEAPRKLSPPPPPSNPRSRKREPVPMLTDRTSAPRLKDRSTSASVPRTPKPPRLPLSPAPPGSPRALEGPRFMSLAQAEGIETVEYRPRPKYTTMPKYPTIMGVTPTRLQPKPVAEVRREPRPMRVLKALKNPDMVRKKWKGTVKNFMRMRVMKRLNGCMRALHAEAKEIQTQESMPLEIEYKPIYRLKEIKRASILLSLPKPKKPRPVSVASMGSLLSTVDRRRYSEASVYSRPGSTANFSEYFSNQIASSQEVSSDEDLSLRASLLPYREWWTFFQSKTNPFTEDNTNDGRASLDAPVTSIHSSSHNSHRASSLFSIPQQNSSQNHPDFDSPENDASKPPSPTSSELTVTPSRFTFAQTMAEEAKTSSQEAFGSKGLGGLTVEGTSDGMTAGAATTKNAQDPHVKQIFASNMETSQQEAFQKQASPKDDSHDAKVQTYRKASDDSASRIPRGPSHKPYTGLAKGSRSTPDHRSSIPISSTVRRQSAGNVESPSEGFSGGIRVLERPLGPRPRSSGEPTGSSVSESIQETGKELRKSSSSSSISDWDLSDDDLQKPPTVFTGEFRTSISERQAQHRYGPTLKITGSADNIIMGTNDRPRSSIVTQRSSPLRVKYIDMSKPITQKDSVDTRKGQIGEPQDQSESEKQLPVKNFCRPQVSFENLPKKDISGRELSVARKPLNRPGLNNFIVGSADKSNENTPPVPKVITEGSVHKASAFSEAKHADAAAPAPSSRQDETSPAGSTPEPMRQDMAPLRSHPPPRMSSLQAVADFPMHSEADDNPKTPTELSFKEKEGDNLTRDVTFDNMAEARASREQSHSTEVSRLPDSRSNRMLDSFRNIFKHKGGTEKGRTKKEEPDQVPMLPKDQSTVNVKSDKSKEGKPDSTKAGPKTKTKYPKLEGVGWNKASRNHKTPGEISPALVPTPTSTLSSSFPTPNPLNRYPPDDRTPSFARPTKSTRTKAASSSKPQPTVPGTQEGRPRRVIQNVASSTGSPQRPARTGTKRMSMVSTGQRPSISHPRPIVSPSANQENIAPGAGGKQRTESAQRSFKDIRFCIEKLCNKARDEGTPDQREKYLRLALSLQQQLSDFQSIEREASEAQIILNSKKSDQGSAKETLFEYFTQVQMQLDEE